MHGARVAVALSTALLSTCTLALAWRLFGLGPGLLGGLLLLLDPYLVGMSRLLHPDALLAPLMAVSLLAALVALIGQGNRRYWLLSAAAGGLALLTKAPALFLPLFCGFLVSRAALDERKSGRAWLGRARLFLSWGLLATVVVLACWPALWANLPRRLEQTVRYSLLVAGRPHAETNFFLGSMVADPGPSYYPVALAFRLSPIVLVGLLALAMALVSRRRGPQLDRAAWWLLGAAVLFVVVISLSPKKFDRYALPAIWLLDLLAGWGLWTLLRRAGRLRWTVLVLPLVLQVGLLWRSYPYPLAAYSPLLGGAEGARAALVVGWGEGLEQVAGYLNSLPNSDRLAVASNYQSVLRPQFRGTTISSRNPTDPDYLVLYVNKVQREDVSLRVQQALAPGPPVFTAYIHGAEYAWVYRVSAASTLTDLRLDNAEDEET